MTAGLLVILTCADGERFAAATETAAAAAALGRPVALLLRGKAVTLGAPLPPALALLAEMGAEIGYCQTALAERQLDAAAHIPPEGKATGLIRFLANRHDWQILLA